VRYQPEGRLDPWMIALRIVHLLSGAFWVGGALFLEFIVMRNLRRMAPTIRGPVLGALAPDITRSLSVAAGLVLVTGVVIALRVKWDILDTFFQRGWGYAILTGFLAALVATGTGFGIAARKIKQLVTLGGSIQGRPPSPAEGAQLGALQAQATLATSITTALIVVTLGAMAAARWL